MEAYNYKLATRASQLQPFSGRDFFTGTKKGLPLPSCYVEELAWTEAMHQVWVSLYTDKLDGPPLAMILKADRETIF